MKKLVLSAAALMLATAFSFAGTPETKTEAKQPKITADAATTYYVVGQSGDSYLLSTNPSNESNCGSGSFPCRFTSPNASLGTSIPKETVDDQMDDIQIEAYRTTLP